MCDLSYFDLSYFVDWNFSLEELQDGNISPLQMLLPEETLTSFNMNQNNNF